MCQNGKWPLHWSFTYNICTKWSIVTASRPAEAVDTRAIVASNCSARNQKTKRHKFGRQYDLQTFLPSLIPFHLLLCVCLQNHIYIPSPPKRWWSLFKNGLSKNLENFASEGDVFFLLHQVCINVTESRCNIHLYLECKTTVTSTKFPSDKKVKVSFTPKNCTVIEETVYHKKPKPKCITEERENCVEAWKTLANGTQVLQQISNKEPHNFWGHFRWCSGARVFFWQCG